MLGETNDYQNSDAASSGIESMSEDGEQVFMESVQKQWDVTKNVSGSRMNGGYMSPKLMENKRKSLPITNKPNSIRPSTLEDRRTTV